MSISHHIIGGAASTKRRNLESAEPLPVAVEEITPGWLSKILGVSIDALRIHEIIHGSGTNVLIEVTYSKSNGPSKRPPPTRLCVKGGFNPQLLEMLPSLFAVYRLEAQFYHHIAPLIPGLRLIPTHWCGTDPPATGARGQGIVVMQDIKAAGYAFGDPLRTWPVARVRAGLVQLAKLHAHTWGAREADFPGVPREFGLREVITGMMSPENWELRFADPAVRPPIPEVLWADRDRVVRGMQALWANADRRMVCLVHGDTQIGNTFVDADGQPGFLDWQCVHVNSGVHDVTYFMTGALTIRERRAHERELFGFYLNELHKAGAPKFEVEEVWDVS